jgi:hypothetical protein
MPQGWKREETPVKDPSAKRQLKVSPFRSA